MRMKLIGTCLCWLLLTKAAVGVAQEGDQKTSPKLPAHPSVWINSPPISNEMLAGKAAVLYFFEETCPRCVEAWPRVLMQSAKFEGEPVMFIAVNSGSPRPQLEAYLRKNNVKWPVICDSDRSFEKQFDFTVSLENTKQLRLLQPDGKFKNGDAENIEGSAVDALRDAKWKIEPKDIPPVLQSAWLAIEFGNYPGAAQTLKKNLNGKGEIKDAATRLNQFVLDDLAGQVDAAKKSLDDGKKWEAFKRYAVIPLKFKGFAVPADVSSTLKELAADEAIKGEQAAMRQFDAAVQTASRSPSARKGAIKLLEKLIKDHPDTEAAAEAQKVVEQAGM
ncbi:MAG: hypothetical protein DWI21_01505 [Planctomycetota bacterium]|nr:MAG: hypothetical protein DWI21_01505 [Planctomycetota bacterium]GDY08510.1 hypothetical protein LBMAG52_19960 [Planctomycetia bacterium]